MKITILGSWHGGANCTQYAQAFEGLGHQVLRIGPRFTPSDAARWHNGLLRMAWPPSVNEADRYVQLVLAMSPVPEVETGKGGGFNEYLLQDSDLILVFDQYGEQPSISYSRQTCPTVAIYSDPHTGRLQSQITEAQSYDHVFVFHYSFVQPFKDAGCHSAHWLPAAADPDIWTYQPDTEKQYDVLFVGATDPYVHSERVQLIRYLQDQRIDVTVKHAFGPDAARLFSQAKVVLNRSLAGDLNMRVLEATLAGARLVTDRVEGMDDLGLEPWWLYNSTGWQSDYDHAVHQSISGMMDENGDADAMMGRRLALAHHTYQHRATQILETVFA
tara:strand:- start:2013 stop:3002 length:990 start_codon:yes stop_codon:yes gene_type:complete